MKAVSHPISFFRSKSDLELFYFDNQKVNNEQVFIFLHGLGLDYRDFQNAIKSIDYRCLVPTLYGFYPSSQSTSKGLTLEEHCKLLKEWLEAILRNIQPKKVTLVGFSAGADIGLMFIRSLSNQQIKEFNIQNLICLDCNLNVDTCFFTSAFSKYKNNILPQTIFKEIKEQTIVMLIRSQQCRERLYQSFNEINAYLERLSVKFNRDNLNILTSFASQLFQRYDSTDFEYFKTLAQEVQGKIELTCILSYDNSIVYKNLLLSSGKKQIDMKGSYKVICEEQCTHFDLIQKENLERYLYQIT